MPQQTLVFKECGIVPLCKEAEFLGLVVHNWNGGEGSHPFGEVEKAYCKILAKKLRYRALVAQTLTPDFRLTAQVKTDTSSYIVSFLVCRYWQGSSAPTWGLRYVGHELLHGPIVDRHNLNVDIQREAAKIVQYDAENYGMQISSLILFH
jgi:hypothetical protein